MHPEVFNLLAQLPVADEQENFQILFESPTVRVERIVSDKHSSPPDFWYDQADDEWVMVLQGEATLEYFGGEQQKLRAGDSLCVPAHCRHRVAATGLRTVWLAIHLLG